MQALQDIIMTAAPEQQTQLLRLCMPAEAAGFDISRRVAGSGTAAQKQLSDGCYLSQQHLL
jgi:hypothetical protein